jgi:hypothetical protein
MRGANVSFDALSAKFGIPKTIIIRHWHDHVTPEAKAAYSIGPCTLEQARERAAAEGGSVVDYFAITRSILVGQLLKQDEANSAQGVATVAGRLVEVLRELGKISGEIARVAAPSTTVNVSVNAAPGFADLQAGLLNIARAHPAARGDIVALLRRLDGAPEPMPRPVAAIEHEPAHA